jgi:two-component system response regulator YesN
MYSLIVVDDEPAIRNGLVERVNWEELGFEVVGSFEDGEDALQYLRAHPVDVVLTDIRMAVLSGLELAGEVVAQELPTRIVLLSGYREFEYAREAMSHGIRHYLLKPTDVNEVQRVFGELKSELDVAGETDEPAKVPRSLLRKARKELLFDLVAGLDIDQTLLKERWKQCGLRSIGNSRSATYLVAACGGEKDRIATLIEAGSMHVWMDDEQEQVIPLTGPPDILHLLVIAGDKNAISAESLAQRLLNRSGEPKDDSWLLTQLRIDDFQGLKKIGAGQPTPEEPAIRLDEEIPGLRSAAIRGDREELEHSLTRFLARPQEAGLTIGAIRNAAAHLTLRVVDMCAVRSGREAVDYNTVFTLESVDEIRQWTTDTLLRVASKSPPAAGPETVASVKSYVAENLSADLSLENTASKFYVSPGYLSRLFRKHAGVGYLQFVTESRVRRASTLLGHVPKLPIAEISRQVGYHDEKYFSRLFKSHVGRTPTEFRRELVH